MGADHRKLSVEELDALDGAALPERMAMSTLMLPTPVGADPRVLVGGAADERPKEENDQMTDTYHKLSRDELAELAGEELPERAAMSLINANLAIPVNAAVAANVLSDGSTAYADAVQGTPITQGN
jgi:hypothetical protein